MRLIQLISTLITPIDFRVYSRHPGLDTPDSRTDATQRLDSPSIARRRGRAAASVREGDGERTVREYQYNLRIERCRR